MGTVIGTNICARGLEDDTNYLEISLLKLM